MEIRTKDRYILMETISTFTFVEGQVVLIGYNSIINIKTQ